MIPEGQRDSTLTQVAGKLRRIGFPPETIAAALHVENRRRCAPPLSDFDVERIARSVGRYAAPSDGQEGPQGAGLEFITFADLAREVDAAGPRRWLLRGLWPSGDYGVHAAEMKAQKTWNGVDMAVAVASGTPWLGHVPVDDPGPVLLFVGEGGRQNIVRRVPSCGRGPRRGRGHAAHHRLPEGAAHEQRRAPCERWRGRSTHSAPSS